MADVIWVYAELSDERFTPTTLEMLTKAAEVGKAEAVLLGPAPDDAAQTLANYRGKQDLPVRRIRYIVIT